MTSRPLRPPMLGGGMLCTAPTWRVRTAGVPTSPRMPEVDWHPDPQAPEPLTKHEFGVLLERMERQKLCPMYFPIIAALLDGCDNEEIARRSHLSVATVKVNLSKLSQILGVHSRLQIVLRYARGI